MPAIYFAADAKMSQLYRLDYRKPLGFVAQRERKAVRARILVLMSGLVHVPFEDTLKLVRGGLEPDGFHFTLVSDPGLACGLQRSTNLSSWEEFLAVTNVTGELQITDTNAVSTSYRFYRAVGRLP